jgi:hypothetical protein
MASPDTDPTNTEAVFTVLDDTKLSGRTVLVSGRPSRRKTTAESSCRATDKGIMRLDAGELLPRRAAPETAAKYLTPKKSLGNGAI